MALDGLPPATDGLAVGLLGGSFNPAHEGHLHISRLALALLGLDELWWLVSPQNPLKPLAGMAPRAARLAAAQALAAHHPRVRATDIEASLGTCYTADTLAGLARRFPRTRFVWIMGADNLLQIPRWERWTQIFHTVPVAIFARPSYSLRALSGQAAQRFRGRRITSRQARRIADMEPPAWVFLHTPLSTASATRIRAMQARRDGSPRGPGRVG